MSGRNLENYCVLNSVCDHVILSYNVAESRCKKG
jgi:hypothetical protein